MSFSGMKAVVLIGVLFALVVAVHKFGLPGWLVPVGLLLTGAILRGSEKKSSTPTGQVNKTI